MGDPRHDRVKQLFMGALEQPDPADCEDWLRRQGAGEQTLDRVRALLLQNSETLSAARPVNGLLAELGVTPVVEESPDAAGKDGETPQP